MFSMLNRLRRKLFRPVPRKKPPQQPSFVPRLEPLEDRLVLDAMLFTGAGTALAPALWSAVGNWTDLTNPLYVHVPTAADDVGIPGGAGYVLISGANASVNSIVTVAPSVLTIASGVELKINSNPPTSGPPDMPLTPVPGQNYFGGDVIDLGHLILNTTNPFTGTNAIFAGGATIGPGDLNGNLVAGPNSSFTFAPPSGGPDAPNVFAAGATFGIGSGTVNIDAPVSFMGNFIYGTMTIDLNPGGTLGGPGSIDDWSNFNWTGGTLSVTGGVDVYEQ